VTRTAKPPRAQALCKGSDLPLDNRRPDHLDRDRRGWAMRLALAGLIVPLVACSAPEDPSRSPPDAEEVSLSEPSVEDPRAVWAERVVPVRDPAVAATISRAVVVNESRSAAQGLVEQREAERATTAWGRRPQLEPVASIDSEGTTNLGLGLSIPIFDFGRNNARTAQADAAIRLAELEYWIERNEAASIALEHLASAAEAIALVEVTVASRDRVQTLLDMSQQRVQSGVADRAELELITLRLSELDNDIANDRSALQLALSLLAEAIEENRTSSDVPSLDAMITSLDHSEIAAVPPLVLRAEYAEERSEFILDQVRAERLPRLVLQASATHDGAEPSTAATLSLDTSGASILGAGARIDAARSAVSVARSETLRSVQQAQTERDRLRHERQRLLEQSASLSALITQSRRSADLFEQQHSIGSRPLTDGITVLRTLLQAERDRIAAQASLARLLVSRAAMDGRLVAPDLSPDGQ